MDSIFRITVITSTPSSLSLGAPLTFIAHASLLNDSTPNNNADTLIARIVGSFDPNGKSVNRPDSVVSGKEMIYTVDFQNTGTYSARNVVVIDSISSELDMSTFKLISGSPTLPRVTSKDGRRLIFDFDNINLPDSKTNEPLSHGQFVYSLFSKNKLPIGDVINNTAYIYFDFNLPIVTNTTVNIIGEKTKLYTYEITKDNDVLVYPNPTTQNINIILANTNNAWTISVTDVLGREIYYHSTAINENNISIDLNSMPGIYFMKIINMTTYQSKVEKIILRK
jgi:uncharacterized repeat protein (TIGR01451 family)